MIRFVLISDQIEENKNQFSFYCTVKDKFKTFFGCQVWDSIDGFVSDFKEEPDGDIERYLRLIPNDYVARESIGWDDCVLSVNGEKRDTQPFELIISNLKTGLPK